MEAIPNVAIVGVLNGKKYIFVKRPIGKGGCSGCVFDRLVNPQSPCTVEPGSPMRMFGGHIPCGLATDGIWVEYNPNDPNNVYTWMNK